MALRAQRVEEVPSGPGVRRRDSVLAAGQAGLLAAAVATAVLATGADDWKPAGLVLSLLGLAVAGQLFALRAGSGHIGPPFVATALAMALLGPAPAAIVALSALAVHMVATRTPLPLAYGNVVALTVYPVAGAMLFVALGDPGADASASVGGAAIVFAVYLATSALNFLLVVGVLCLRDGASLGGAVRRLYLPVLPWELASGLLTAGAVVAYQEIGLIAIALLAVVLVALRLLSLFVADTQRERDELRVQVAELEALHQGVIGVMVETLGMRDRMTARHSAAVARFAKATAAAADLPVRDQELVHTAGLLHDVGKFTFPDHTLTGTRLTEEDWELIRSHPQRGADIVGRVHGYREVAEIVLCHHERIDGRGYPRRLRGDEIPVLARILAVADCFDVMTARDSYRTAMSFDAAIEELRRVAGTQLDPVYVEIFVGIVMGSGVELEQEGDAAEELRRAWTAERA
jgi:putative nucleotidyltransferase with HDIG domain